MEHVRQPGATTPRNDFGDDYWNSKGGQTWVRLQERLDDAMAPLTDMALDAAAPQAGERVIDVGCGGGATVIELARRVGPAGHVPGVDVSEVMAAHARDRIVAERLLNAELQVADAASAQFASADADLMFSRFGVMFFSQPDAAFTHMRRAMRPGGRLLFVAWRSREENAWAAVPLEAGKPFLPSEPKADPHAPGPYAFADPKRVQAILQAGGWDDISIVPHDAPVRLSKAGDL